MENPIRQNSPPLYEKIEQSIMHDATPEQQDLLQAAYSSLAEHSSESELQFFSQTALIVSDELNLNSTAAIAMLLYLPFKNKKIRPETLQEEFGETVFSLLNGFSKIIRTNFDPEETENFENQSLSDKKREKEKRKKIETQTENSIQLLLTLANDFRSILLALAYRVNQMRNLEASPPVERQKIAGETYNVYAPVAHRLGLYNIKTELEERSMKQLFGAVYRSIAEKLAETKAGREKFIENFISPIRKELKKEGFDCEIKARPKSIHSIWKKMKRQDVGVEGIYDLFAIRIILSGNYQNKKDEKADCWRVYSIISDWYTPMPKRLRDWISSPKKSGYESLHTTVATKDPKHKWVEVQIRTQRMDEIAEKGQAAHWRYKQGEGNDGGDWLGKMRQMLESGEATQEESEHSAVKKELYSDEILIFTPKGELKKLPNGATVLDFAFSIHSNLGKQCVGARIGKRMVPISHKIENGDQVEILTSRRQKPKISWMEYVSTNKAKSCIKREMKQQSLLEIGKRRLREKLKNLSIPFNKENVSALSARFRFRGAFDFYQAVGKGSFDLTRIKKDFFAQPETEDNHDESPEEKRSNQQKTKTTSPPRQEDYLLIDKNLDKIQYKRAQCCNPLPGEPIVGFVTINNGITVHKPTCRNAKHMLERYPHRHVSVKWKDDIEQNLFPASLRISGNDQFGVVNDISELITNQLNMNLGDVKFNVQDGRYSSQITVYVSNTKQLEGLITRLRNLNSVAKVSRIK